jgi:DNA-binding transcriptional LysR family regulator
MNSIKAIPIFVAVTDNGGFSQAARVLGISKSAVSQRITQLEDHLGARLFHRTTRKLSLTEAGERYYQYAAQAQRAAQQAEDAVGELQGEPKGLLKVQLPMTLGQMHIAPLIPNFLKRYPHVQLDVVMDDRHLNLVEHGFDLAIGAGDLPDSNLIARPLVPLHSAVCVSPEFYQTHQQTLKSPRQLSEINCIIYSYSRNADVWKFKAGNGDEHKIRVKGNYRVNNSAALRDAIIAGIGAGRLPTFVAGDAICKGALVPLFTDHSMPSQQLYAIYPERSYLPEKVRVFIDFLSEQLGKGSAYWDDY